MKRTISTCTSNNDSSVKSNKTLRRSERIPQPRSPSIYNVIEPSPKRRRLRRSTINSLYSNIPNPNANCPLLRLSYELVHQIALYLHPREAIFLSLTSRQLYYGPLGEENSQLWYRLGRFNELIPGRDPVWIENLRWYYSYEAPKDVRARLCKNERQDPDEMGMKLTFGTRRLGVDSPLREYFPASMGLPPWGVSYKEVLVRTMLGDTKSGCQWCLTEPLTIRWYSGWDIRVCYHCFHANIIQAFKLKGINIDTQAAKLPITGGLRRYRGGGSWIYGFWKPSIEKLIQASYGPDATLHQVQKQVAHDEAKKKAERLQERTTYRIKQLEILFEYIKELWDILHRAGNKLHTIRSCSDVGNIGGSEHSIHDGEISSRTETPEMESDPVTAEFLNKLRATKLHRSTPFIPPEEKLIRHLPTLLRIASLVPSSQLKSNWFLPDHLKPQMRRRRRFRYLFAPPDSYDPTCPGYSDVFSRKFRVYPNRNQTPSWFVETAWTILVNCVSRESRQYSMKRPGLLYRLGPPCQGGAQMEVQFVQWFKESWGAVLEQDVVVAEGEGNNVGEGSAAPQENIDPEKMWRNIFHTWWRDPIHFKSTNSHIMLLASIPEPYKSKIVSLNEESTKQAGSEEVWAQVGVQIFEMGKRLP